MHWLLARIRFHQDFHLSKLFNDKKHAQISLKVRLSLLDYFSLLLLLSHIWNIVLPLKVHVVSLLPTIPCQCRHLFQLCLSSLFFSFFLSSFLPLYTWLFVSFPYRFRYLSQFVSLFSIFSSLALVFSLFLPFLFLSLFFHSFPSSSFFSSCLLSFIGTACSCCSEKFYLCEFFFVKRVAHKPAISTWMFVLCCLNVKVNI